MLTYHYYHTIDVKGRFFIPSKYRDDLGESFFITKGINKCLLIYPMDEWKKFEAKLLQLPKLGDKKAKQLSSFFFNWGLECEMDKQGRTLLPAKLRDFAGLGKDIIIAGESDHAEIWDKDTWEAQNSELEMKEEDIFDTLGKYGL